MGADLSGIEFAAIVDEAIEAGATTSDRNESETFETRVMATLLDTPTFRSVLSKA